jgi:hypothetical protein
MQVDTRGFALGDVVSDKITGAVGVITGIHLYTTGCARLSIQPRILADGKVPDVVGSDVLCVEMVEQGKFSLEEVDRNIGGPHDDPVLSNPAR